MTDDGDNSDGPFVEDLQQLLDELDSPLLIEVGEPNAIMNLLCERLARCPAAHNRLLFDGRGDAGLDAR